MTELVDPETKEDLPPAGAEVEPSEDTTVSPGGDLIQKASTEGMDSTILKEACEIILKDLDDSEVVTIVYKGLAFSAHKRNGELYAASEEELNGDMNRCINNTRRSCQRE